MKKLVYLLPLMIALLFNVSAHAQQMPVGLLVHNIDCSLNDGVSMAQVVRFARAAPRDENSANLIFFRESIFAGGYGENYDFRIANYYPNYVEFNSRTDANRARPGTRVRPALRGTDLFTCNPGTNRVLRVRGIPDTDPFTGDETLMTTRLCLLNEGYSYADAYQFILGVGENFRNEGNNSIMQLYSPSLGPLPAAFRRSVIIAEVSETSNRMAERMDIVGRNDFRARSGLDNVVSCNVPALWRTHAIYRSNN